MKNMRNLSGKLCRWMASYLLLFVLVLNVGLLPAMATLQIEDGKPESDDSILLEEEYDEYDEYADDGYEFDADDSYADGYDLDDGATYMDEADSEDVASYDAEDGDQAEVTPLPGNHTDLPMVTDSGELLEDWEEQELEEALQEICRKWNIDLAVLTVDDLGGKSAMQYADDFYDENGYAENGCILLVSMSERDYWISTSGSLISALTDMGIDFMGQAVAEKLTQGDYQGAFLKFGSMVDSFVEEYQNGSAYDIDNLPDDDDYDFDYDGDYNDLYEAQRKAGFRPHLLLAGLGIGAIISLIIMTGYKAQIKNVHSQHGASDYLKKNSVSIYRKDDRFLYRNVTSTPKPKPQENRSDFGGHSGGSSIHMSSGGHSHGGGGGKF